ncbi:MAG: hypothetical protein A2231_02415 [Candidatus Firestonebacteria bacterium RIFOXYA2_FULL_40_8]|nr:MAG: hypothetical protein A2231_02415 [Candidatus Firestonebacteria bacterium RIFOXYA2_FULL_40_8]
MNKKRITYELRRVKKGFTTLFLNPTILFQYLKSNFLLFLSDFQFKPKNNILTLGNVKLLIDFKSLGIDRASKQIFYNCYEVSTVYNLYKYLKKGDIFIDVGANIGYMSAIAASIVGTEGEIHSFEPVPNYYKYVNEFTKMNPSYKIKANNKALGEKDGMIEMDYLKPPHWGGSSLVKGLVKNANAAIPIETIQVPVIRLDDYLLNNNLNKIRIIKIDAEGFEYFILKGLSKYFEKTKDRPIIICEIVPQAYQFIKHTRNDLLEYMKQYGYKAYNILNSNYEKDINVFTEADNVVFKPEDCN